MADEFVTIEYRGIIGDLPIGSTVRVESWGAGVLRLRVAPAMGPTAALLAPKPEAPAEPAKPHKGEAQ